MSQQFLKLLICKTGVPDDRFDRVGVEALVAGDGDVVEAVRQAEMFALVDNLEADFPKGTHDPLGRQVREEHLHGDVDLGRLLFAGLFLDHEKIGMDRVFNVVERVFQRVALADTPWQSWALHMVAVPAFLHDHRIGHGSSVDFAHSVLLDYTRPALQFQFKDNRREVP